MYEKFVLSSQNDGYFGFENRVRESKFVLPYKNILNTQFIFVVTGKK